MSVARRALAWIVAVCGVAAVACTARPIVTDTGYTGTWSRGNGVVYSVVAIDKRGDRYAFRWSKHSSQEDLDIRCGWDGRCEELFRGHRDATYEFSTRVDPVTHHLLVECDERRVAPEKLDLHYVDELVVEPGGKVLWSYTIERNGERFEGNARPMRSFEKVSDGFAGPPPGGR